MTANAGNTEHLFAMAKPVRYKDYQYDGSSLTRCWQVCALH